jgi:hypothetical protein
MTTLTIPGPFDVPVHLHWSVLLGGLMPCVYVGFNIIEILFFTVAFILLVAIHEFGHAFAAKLLGLRVFEVQINVSGGHCRYEMPPTIWKALLVTSGGIFAQVILLLIAMIYIAIFGYESSRVMNCFLLVFTFINFLMLIVNVIPAKVIAGLSTDGLVLWKLTIAWIRVLRKTAAHTRKERKNSIMGHY